MWYDKATTANNAAWIDRNVETHQMLVDWQQAAATRDNRLSGTSWTNQTQYGLAGTDYASAAESSTLFTVNTFAGSFQQWDLTSLAQKWVDGTANFGVMLIADNESTNGQDLRFSSAESASSLYDQPYLEVEWYQPMRTVYFLKDHLGSIRATVDDAGQVVAYDDYDPWGMIMPGRSMTTQANLPNKFTGKEWDDDFGLNWHHFDRRPYDGEIARWLSVEPLQNSLSPKKMIASPDYLSSPYTYVLNNPPNNIDPNGLHTLSVGVGTIGQAIMPGGHASLGVVADFKGNVGVSLTVGASVGVGIGGVVGLVGQYTSAETIYDTAGPTNTGGIHSPFGGVEFNALTAENSEGKTTGEMTAWGLTVSTPSAGGGGYFASEQTFVTGTTWKKLGSISASLVKGAKLVVNKTGQLFLLMKDGQLVDTGLQFDIVEHQEQNDDNEEEGK